MVHITDTRSQKVVSYTSAHITETVFAHDQHWEEHSALSVCVRVKVMVCVRVKVSQSCESDAPI